MTTEKKTLKDALYRAGIPLELEIYRELTHLYKEDNIAGFNINYILPDYSFLSLNEEGKQTTRSIDYVVSVGKHNRNQKFSRHVYFLIECKSVNPKKNEVWLFMHDYVPRKNTVFKTPHITLHRVSLLDKFEELEVFEELANSKKWQLSESEIIESLKKKYVHCVKGYALCNEYDKHDEKGKPIQTALHQIRGALHNLAIDKFSLLIQQFDAAHCVCFIPIIVTNAEIRLLKPAETISVKDDAKIDDISYPVNGVLCKVPQDLNQLNPNIEKFRNTYSEDSLKQVFQTMHFKSKVSFVNRVVSFFGETPAYAYIIHNSVFLDVFRKELRWAQQLELE